MPASQRKWVDISYLIVDREYLRLLESRDSEPSIHLATPLQSLRVKDDGGFEDGPSCPRVAILDFDEQTGKLREGARFLPAGNSPTISVYDINDDSLGPDSSPEAFENDAFIQTSVFGTILKALEFFESPEVLGRRIPWAFNSEQLYVYPRAGRKMNAYYERETGSLKFFYDRSAGGFNIYTALSHDIVFHEASHAIIDALAPGLYDAATPQSLALHEALADLAAVTQKLLNEMVLFSLSALSAPAADETEVLSRIAEEFGTDTRLKEGANFLRRLKNDRTLDSDDPSTDEFGRPNSPSPTDFHMLSTVLSGAVYSVMESRMRATKRNDRDIYDLSLTFIPGARRVARIIFRALEFLPPGDASFVDYGRAFIAAAGASYARPQKEQQWLRAEFLRRKIVDDEGSLDIEAGQVALDFGEATPEQFLSDDEQLRKFAEQNRGALKIPEKTPFSIMEPSSAAWTPARSRENKHSNIVTIKFTWEEFEYHELGPGFTRKWAVKKGTTLVMDRESGTVLSNLTTETSPALTAQRNALLKNWVQSGRLKRLTASERSGDTELANSIIARERDGALRIEGSARLLHITD